MRYFSIANTPLDKMECPNIKNITSIGTILAMLIHSKWKKFYWVEIILTSNYLQNWSPTQNP